MKKPLINNEGEVRELTIEDMADFTPLADNPELLAHLKRSVGQRGPQKEPTKEHTSIRLSSEVMTYFRATGKGWQGRIDEVLLNYVRNADDINKANLK